MHPLSYFYSLLCRKVGITSPYLNFPYSLEICVPSVSMTGVILKIG